MKRMHRSLSGFLLPVAVMLWGVVPPSAMAWEYQIKLNEVRRTGVADYNASPNWANSPPLQKFVDGLPGICGSPVGTDGDGANNLWQCMPAAVPDTTTYTDSDYYELEIVQYREQMHSDLDPLRDAANNIIVNPTAAQKMDPTTTGGTLLRGYRQTNTTGAPTVPHYLGPIIVAQKDRPVRIKFVNKLPTGSGGDLFVPTDTTIMGSGPGPLSTRTAGLNDAEVCQAEPQNCFRQNRADLHLHGGRTPWISDGTAHQWITPKGEIDPASNLAPYYDKGVSVAYVPDMWYHKDTGAHLTTCAGKTVCSDPNATNNPGPGAQTYYFTNAQSARMMFYHDHSWGITRLNVYVGGAAGYIVTDPTEAKLANLIPGAAYTIPLIIQDKTYVDPNTIVDNIATPGVANDGTDPTWIWGSKPGNIKTGYSSAGAEPVKGDLWWPHVYVPAQNPYNPNMSGINDFGRWHYGPWFWPPVATGFGPKPNPYFDEVNDPDQPPEIPSTPNPSWGAEAFMDTPVINGTAYPKLEVEAKPYRFRILNAAHDRFWNLQLYVADPTAVDANGNPVLTEVKMIPAVPANNSADLVASNDGFDWPADGREGGVPDPTLRGPAMVQIMTEGGFLPKPVVLKNRPINWNVDPTTFTAGLVLQQNQGGGTLMLGPAERADVIVDFKDFAGKTLILYNDAPAPWPALDPHYDYYTGAPDNTGMGGVSGTPVGYGPNTRTLMQITVTGSGGPATPNAQPDITALNDAFRPVAAGGLGIFDEGQEPIIVGQKEYDGVYYANGAPVTFPGTWPNWGVSRITDTAISFKTPEGATVSMYPMEPKAIQDEMGETFDEFGRMSAKLGLELAKTTAGIQTFVLQNFVDPATEKVKKDQVQIWKITHNGVDTHPVHFHLFEVQLINRVGWDGFIYKPDPNELGWKDTIRISPLQDTIVALRPAKIPVPFNVPNSLRPYNPAYPIGAKDAGFTNLDPATAQPLAIPTVNEVVNFGHEYLWHCHILSHEEADMMRPIILNANSLLYTLNGTNGFWQWDMGTWKQITDAQPISIVSSGSFAYANMGTNGLWEYNGYTWKQISTLTPTLMLANDSSLYAAFGDSGLYKWNKNSWTKLHRLSPAKMVASGTKLFADFTGQGLFVWNGGTTWARIHQLSPVKMVATEKDLFVEFSGQGVFRWTGSSFARIQQLSPANMIASETDLFVDFAGQGLFRWTGSSFERIHRLSPLSMEASKSTLYATFAGQGLFEWKGAGASFGRININIPTSMEASGSILFANFGGAVSKWEFNKWSPLLNNTPVTSISAGY